MNGNTISLIDLAAPTPSVVRTIDDKTLLTLALIENLQRKDLTIWEEADGLKALADKFSYTQEEIAKKISKSRTTVNELMTIAGLPDAVRGCLAALAMQLPAVAAAAGRGAGARPAGAAVGRAGRRANAVRRP